MSKYTSQLKNIVEVYSSKNKPFSKRIEESLPIIFDFYYPLWNESYKRTLEKKIIMHYINKEICAETLALWKMFLEERLNLIMPYYNELYKTIDIKYDWLTDIEMNEIYSSDKKGNIQDLTKSKADNLTKNNEHSNSTSNDENKTLKSDLPQANYNNQDYGTELIEDTNKNNSTANSDSTSTANNNSEITSSNESVYNDKYSRRNSGLSGSRTRTNLITEYRNSIVNIDRLIINELKDLFMLIY